MQARPGSRRHAQRAEVTESLTLRQHKTFYPAERASRALRAPHDAGLFAEGS